MPGNWSLSVNKEKAVLRQPCPRLISHNKKAALPVNKKGV